MKKLLFLFLYLPIISVAQQDSASKGIHFTEGLPWPQILAKAKQENKHIFLDCYTTWCGPCKMMDASVYPNDSVGEYFNQHFISVKVQMDKTKKDNEQIKSWYDDAAAIGKEYHVEGYPTFVFLSPSGDIVNKELGLKGVKEFIAIGQGATAPGLVYNDPYKVYERLIQEYKQGIIIYDSLPSMIKMATKLGDTTMQRQLLKVHVDYEVSLPPVQRYTKKNIQFWASYSLGSTTRLFSFFYKDGNNIDKIMNQKGFAAKVIDRTIIDEIITPFFKEQAKGSKIAMTGGYITDISGKHLLKTDSSEADWQKLDKLIREKYSAGYAKRNLLTAKIEWYLRHRNYSLYAKYYLLQLDKYPPDISERWFSDRINSFAWTVFLNITDKSLIKGTMRWMEKAVIYNTNGVAFPWMDTYANLLYKAGRRQEAVQWEEKAMNASRGDFADSYKKVIEQMKRGEPTYVKEGAIWNR